MQTSDAGGRIAEYVLEQGLGPGDRMPSERALAAMLSISRPALRETTRRLIDLGILEPRLGDGTYLAAVDPRELIVVRLALEPLAASLAAARRTAGDVSELERLLEAMTATIDDPARYACADLAIHRRIAAASRFRVLIGCLRDLDQMLLFARGRTVHDPNTREATLTGMRLLVGHIDAGRQDAAAAAMRSHLEQVAAAAGCVDVDAARERVAMLR